MKTHVAGYTRSYTNTFAGIWRTPFVGMKKIIF